MTAEKIINLIDSSPSGTRDLLLDELNDCIAAGDLGSMRPDDIVDKISALVPPHSNLAEQESLFNVISSIYLGGECHERIEEIVLSRLFHLKASSLVHALEILAASKLANKRELLRDFAKHENEFIRKLANSLLEQNGGGGL
ncbi:hypothetical protein GCM10007907_17740 [Chitinimonas prasina]|uniref:Immunity protein 30 domain-containing protein n=1 Tax=Chitinimonas prasina TaxID=1434937 RepID=A0ABQ5YDV3_9NEIS|nr:hypothetical protein [Chitinimonas prasina]GLR12984.1 hypothetical protein GCM10007907_17740 [Chitinimonas prasina]